MTCELHISPTSPRLFRALQPLAPIVLAIGMILLAGLGSPVFSEAVNLHVSGGASPNALVFKIANEQGFFKKEGLEVSAITARMQPGIQGLIAGSFHFSQILGAGAVAALRGLPLKIVMVFDTRPIWWLYGNTKIKKIEDLRGKTVGVSSLGAGLDQMTREILPRYGLEVPRDVLFRDVGNSPDRLAAVLTGVVDAAVISSPGNFIARKNGLNEILFYGDQVEYVSGGLVTSEKLLVENPQLVRRFVRATLNAFLWYKSERKQSVMYIKESFKISDQEAQEIYKIVSSVSRLMELYRNLYSNA